METQAFEFDEWNDNYLCEWWAMPDLFHRLVKMTLPDHDL